MEKLKPKVSVIIPVYNCEEYLQRCLESVYSQDFDNFEIIAVNDGSTDSSLSILKDNASRHKNLTIIDQDNKGQGYARNYALGIAKGEYILFLDSDDYIEPFTLRLTVERMEKDESDVVHFDWKFSDTDPGKKDRYHYVNKEPFSYKSILEGSECDEILQMRHYFSVNNLYRKKFLDDNNIRYGEGRVYEDNIFVTMFANRANRISILPSPLYIVHRNEKSTTRDKSSHKTSRHADSFIKAVSDSVAALKPRTPYSNFYLVKYFQDKFFFYYRKRVPIKYKYRFLREYVDAVSIVDVDIPNSNRPERVLRICLERGILLDKKYLQFFVLTLIKTSILPLKDKLKSAVRRIKHRVLRGSSVYRQYLGAPVDKNTILFMGYDFMYSGNSRYLFESVINDKSFSKKRILFATKDKSIKAKNRIEPNSEKYFKELAVAGVVISESWMPRYFVKRDETVVFQLWHGTPLKRMLFDSNERSIMKVNDSHKINKYKDTMKWTYLLADSRIASSKFQTSLLFPESRIIIDQYPRVSYLVKNRSNKKIISSTRVSLGLGEGKKVVLYAPTWRDYNYRKDGSSVDVGYVPNLKKMSSMLGDEYVVVYHGHHYLSSEYSEVEGVIISENENIQDLILTADFIVSDYSSLIYDAFTIGKTVALYVNDYGKYEDSRGVYDDMWADLSNVVTDSVEGVVDIIKNEKKVSLGSEYKSRRTGKLIKAILKS